MTLDEAFDTLGIEDYGDRIVRSSSHGELFFLTQYIALAEQVEDSEHFRDWFDEVVRVAEETWKRPDSVFQHILGIYNHTQGSIKNVSTVVSKR